MPFPDFSDPRELELYLRALQGDEEATKMYCGSYTLVADSNNHLFRCKGEVPNGYSIPEILGPVYDKDGFLLPRFWSLPRI